MKILYIENHESFAKVVIANFLSDHEVKITPSIAGARVLLRNEMFDPVLVDYDLDDGKGKEIVGELAAAPDRPRIIATSSHDEGNQQLVEAGADAVCSKMHFDEIRAVIDQAFWHNG